jgi:hypothetical protein
MIRYNLRCSQAHEFDSWFKDSAAYDKMAGARLVECPVCGDTQVSKALMTPAVAKVPGAKGRPENLPVPAKPEPEIIPPSRAAAGPMPAQMLALLQRLRSEVEKNADYVGKDFAEEARKIHYGETEARGIYGETSDEEAEALREEGIEVTRIPWVPLAD